jgi:NADH-quinone oxidoreductase subunit A
MDESVVNTVDRVGANWIVSNYGDYYAQYGIVLWFILGAVAIGIVAIVLARIIAPYDPSPAKRSTYECSEKPIGSAWIRFNIRYYYFALLFLIFGVEVVFFYPWAVVFHALKTPHMGEFKTAITLGFPIFGEMIVFLFLLLLGWVYAWRKGYLTWD